MAWRHGASSLWHGGRGQAHQHSSGHLAVCRLREGVPRHLRDADGRHPPAAECLVYGHLPSRDVLEGREHHEAQGLARRVAQDRLVPRTSRPPDTGGGFRAYPTPAQEAILTQWFGCAR